MQRRFPLRSDGPWWLAVRTFHPASRRAWTRWRPTKPEAPVTRADLMGLRNIPDGRRRTPWRCGSRCLVAELLEVRVDHHRDELGEADLEFPAQLPAGLGGVAQERVDLGGAHEGGVEHDVFLP